MNSSGRPRIICLGLSALDITWVVDRLPAGGTKTRARDLNEGGGGMAANAAVAAARLGAEVAFWGRAGDDGAGRVMREELRLLGVGVEGFRLFEKARSSVSGILVDTAGERMIANFRGAGLPDDPGWLPLYEVARADAVLADPRWPEGAEALFSAARTAAVAAVLDGDMADPQVFDTLLPLTGYAVFSAPALAAYASDDDVAAGLRFARSKGCGLAAVTLGENGVSWIAEDVLQHLPAFRIRAVDTTGAGDVFHGALVYALGMKMPIGEALRFSSAVAALKCRHSGGRAGIPDLHATQSFLQEFREFT